MAEPPFKNVLIVGAGPSGLLLALLLSKHGISVTIVEASSHLDQQPRAAHYGSPAIPEFIRAGIISQIRERGLVLDAMHWRRPDTHEIITGFDSKNILSDVNGQDLRTHCLVLQDLDQLMLDEVTKKYGGVVHWRHKVLDAGQDGNKAWVDVETPEGKKRMEADYVVGADGANSQVRRSLFGDEFPGFTWDAQIIATNTYYDFEGKFGWRDANLIIHPENFCLIAKITQDGLYRITYGETPGLSHSEYLARQPGKFASILPGHPTPADYKMINFSPYKMHQRCAPKFRVGRICLVADAAHLCNPWGGLGITGGFVDVGGLFDCLYGIYQGKADEAILDVYSEKRIERWNAVINTISQANFTRVKDGDPDTILERDEFLAMLKKGETDEEFLRGVLLGVMDVRYDFTQHYKSAGKL